jgi:hypothetical protein
MGQVCFVWRVWWVIAAGRDEGIVSYKTNEA